MIAPAFAGSLSTEPVTRKRGESFEGSSSEEVSCDIGSSLCDETTNLKICQMESTTLDTGSLTGLALTAGDVPMIESTSLAAGDEDATLWIEGDAQRNKLWNSTGSVCSQSSRSLGLIRQK